MRDGVQEKGPGVPKSESEMVAAACRAIQRAQQDGKARQKVRMLLPRDGVLRPTDEDWPGGIMQLFAACSPLTRSSAPSGVRVRVRAIHVP